VSVAKQQLAPAELKDALEQLTQSQGNTACH
jgi:hypothetical protein